jgi:hypothetical protein
LQHLVNRNFRHTVTPYIWERNTIHRWLLSAALQEYEKIKQNCRRHSYWRR